MVFRQPFDQWWFYHTSMCLWYWEIPESCAWKGHRCKSQTGRWKTLMRTQYWLPCLQVPAWFEAQAYGSYQEAAQSSKSSTLVLVFMMVVEMQNFGEYVSCLVWCLHLSWYITFWHSTRPPESLLNPLVLPTSEARGTCWWEARACEDPSPQHDHRARDDW